MTNPLDKLLNNKINEKENINEIINESETYKLIQNNFSISQEDIEKLEKITISIGRSTKRSIQENCSISKHLHEANEILKNEKRGAWLKYVTEVLKTSRHWAYVYITAYQMHLDTNVPLEVIHSLPQKLMLKISNNLIPIEKKKALLIHDNKAEVEEELEKMIEEPQENNNETIEEPQEKEEKEEKRKIQEIEDIIEAEIIPTKEKDIEDDFSIYLSEIKKIMKKQEISLEKKEKIKEKIKEIHKILEEN